MYAQKERSFTDRPIADRSINDRSITDLFADAFGQSNKLLQNELQLARTEVSEKVAQAGMGIVFIGAGAILAIPAIVILLLALVAWCVQLGMSPLGAHALVGVLCASLGLILVLVGKNRFKPETLTPKVTIQQMESDVGVVKELSK